MRFCLSIKLYLIKFDFKNDAQKANMKAYIVEILSKGSKIPSVLRFLCSLNPNDVNGIICNIGGRRKDPMSRGIF